MIIAMPWQLKKVVPAWIHHTAKRKVKPDHTLNTSTVYLVETVLPEGPQWFFAQLHLLTRK